MSGKNNCSICFEISEKYVTCGSIDCDVVTCSECVNDLITYCYENDNKSVPVCPGTTCARQYLLSRLQNVLNDKTMNEYEEICSNRLESFDTEIVLRKTKAKLINDFRKTRIETVKKFPPAIARLIEISFKSKLMAVTKSNKGVIDKLLTKTRRCSETLCGGRLVIVPNETLFECTKCLNKVCSKCDEKLKDDKNEHICSSDNLESVDYINSLVMCPKCKISVEKTYGCDNMTCAICKTNFSYTTGKLTTRGNHHDVTVVLAKPITLLLLATEERYSGTEFVNLFERINDLKPSLIDVKKNGIPSNQYEKLVKNREENVRYAKGLKTIITHYDNRTLTIDILKETLQSITN